MKIVHVYKDYFPPTRGGIEQTVERMARHQARHGDEVTVLTSADGARRSSEDVVDGVRVIRCTEWARVASAPLCPTMPTRLARLPADVYHLHFPNPTGEVSWLLARPRGALVVSYHSDIVRQAAALRVYRPFVHRVLSEAGAIVAASEQYIDRSEFLRVHRDKCHVVPYGIDVERFRETPRMREQAAALRDRYGTPLTVFVGRLRYYKGLNVLLDSWREARGTLVIVGSGAEGPRLRERHAVLALGERVRFAGDLDDADLLAHLAAADVGVLPSTHPSEAFGIAMVEMLAAGVPVVCTELGTGTTFVNRDGETGLVVPPGDAHALAVALNRITSDSTLRKRLAEGARARAQSVFSVEAMMRGVDRAYQAALGSAGPRPAARTA